MKNITNIQNKICSFNILMNGRIINTSPILFRIHESGNKNIDEILYEHIDSILNIVYDQAISLEDLMDVKIYGVTYDILADNDICESYEMNITDKIKYDNDKIDELITNKINEYSQLVLDKINVNEKCKSFVDAYDIVNKHNVKQISSDTFTQYIMSCFNEEYENNKLNNKFEDCAYRIMTDKFNNLNNK